MKLITTLSVSLILLFSIANAENPPEQFKNKTAYEAVRVIDGDNMVINLDGEETNLRLIGVDAPEIGTPYSNEAKQFLTNLLIGEEVYLEYGKELKDKYGRTLAYVYRAPDGFFVNSEIVRQGYGRAYTKYPFAFAELFLSYEQKAKEHKKGLWSVKSETPEQEAKKASPADKEKSETVYITRTGKKYHRAGCRYLAKSMIPISLKEAKQLGYGPCSVCGPPE